MEFQNPEIVVQKFSVEDIITASGGPEWGGEGEGD